VLALTLSVDLSATVITRSGLGSVKLTSGKLAGATINGVLLSVRAVLGGNTGVLPDGMTLTSTTSST
jgi:hypothetical protein